MDNTPQRTHTPLKFRRFTGSAGGSFADDDTKRYHVFPGNGVWSLEIRELTTTAGVLPRHYRLPVIDGGQYDTEAFCIAVANAYSALGDDYQPGKHQYHSRFVEAVQRAYRATTPTKRVRVTPVQRAALVTIAADSCAPGVKGVTLDALEAKGLTTPNRDPHSLRWYLTDAGRTLLPAAVGASDATPQNAATTQEQTTMTTPDPAARFEARTNDAGNVVVWDYQLNRAALTLFPSDDSAYTVDLMNRDPRATAVLVDGIAVHKLRLPHERAAFPFAQSNHAVHDGDVLVHGDLVAILIDTAYPVALSVNAKGCPRLEPGHNWLTLAGGRYANAFHVAVKVAQQHRIPLLEPEEPPMQPMDAEADVEPVETPAADAGRYSVRMAEPGKLGAYGVWDDVLNRFATTGYGEDDAEFWRENMARSTRDTAELIDGIAVHTLDETDGEAAYGWTQCNDQFKSGDVLVFADVVAIMVKAWPCAITVADRGFHAGLAPGASWLTMDDGEYAAAYRVAVKVAQSLGLPLSAPVEGENGDAGTAHPAPLRVSLLPDVDGLRDAVREVIDNPEEPYQAAGQEQREAERAPRCEQHARRGTGHGVCDAPLDAHGGCPVAFNHVDSVTGGEL
jgi:hypothetical protein